MDAPWWNGEPGSLPSDRDWVGQDERESVPKPTRYSCSDCGKTGTEGYTSVPTTDKVLCKDCAVRRGVAFLFDPRSWSEIAQALKQGAA